MTGPLQLYYAPDNASLCVRLLLERLKLSYETVLVDRRNKDQKSPEYLSMNPNGLIPTLVTPHGPMFETGAILLWLADQHPGEVFPGIDDDDRGQAMMWMFWLSNTLHQNLRRIFYPGQYGNDPKDIREVAKRSLSQNLVIVTSALPIITRHDALACYLVPMLRWMQHYGRVSLDERDALKALAATFEKHPFVLDAAKAEGLGPTPFSKPQAPNPPEGSAL